MKKCFRSRCCCIPDNKWCADNYRLTNEYIQGRCQHAIEVRNIPGILESKDDYFEESKRLKTLSNGLTNLLALKEHPLARTGNINYIRSCIQDEIPFKPKECVYMLSCCGVCSRYCYHRCIQDILHKLYIKAYNIYAGIIPYEKASVISRVSYDVLMNSKTNYQTLLEVLYSFATYMWDEEREDEGFDMDNYKYDYAPRTEVTTDCIGRDRKICNPETGEVIFSNWPESGMCPYCIPRVLVYPGAVRGGRK